MAAGLAFIGGFLLIWLLVLALGIASLIFWIFMVVDCAQRDFGTGKDNDKIVWILILVFLGIIGAIIYYFVIKKKAS